MIVTVRSVMARAVVVVTACVTGVDECRLGDELQLAKVAAAMSAATTTDLRVWNIESLLEGGGEKAIEILEAE